MNRAYYGNYELEKCHEHVHTKIFRTPTCAIVATGNFVLFGKIARMMENVNMQSICLKGLTDIHVAIK